MGIESEEGLLKNDGVFAKRGSGSASGAQKSQPGFRADAELGDELSRHSASRKGCNAGAPDEKSKRFRDLRDEAFRAKVKSRSARGEERAQGKLEQRSCGRSHQSIEDAQAADVWSSRLRTLTSTIAPNGPRFHRNEEEP